MKRKFKKAAKPPPKPRHNPIAVSLVDIIDCWSRRVDLARGIAEIRDDNGKVRKVPLIHTDGNSIFCLGNYEILRRISTFTFTFYLLRGTAGDVEGVIPRILEELSSAFAGNARAFRIMFPYKNENLPELSREAVERFKAHYISRSESGAYVLTDVKMKYTPEQMERKLARLAEKYGHDEPVPDNPVEEVPEPPEETPKPKVTKRFIR